MKTKRKTKPRRGRQTSEFHRYLIEPAFTDNSWRVMVASLNEINRERAKQGLTPRTEAELRQHHMKARPLLLIEAGHQGNYEPGVNEASAELDTIGLRLEKIDKEIDKKKKSASKKANPTGKIWTDKPIRAKVKVTIPRYHDSHFLSSLSASELAEIWRALLPIVQAVRRRDHKFFTDLGRRINQDLKTYADIPGPADPALVKVATLKAKGIAPIKAGDLAKQLAVSVDTARGLAKLVGLELLKAGRPKKTGE